MGARDVDQALSANWVGQRLGMDPVRINAMRRGGELYATRAPGSQEWRYPAWQFDADWRVRPAVARVLRAAREAGLRGEELDALLQRRAGLAGTRRRLLDVLLEGDPQPLLAQIKQR